uniref:Calcium uniporter regulatory subunit MCUb n=1 Tax=Paramormyrops kingsleyae TaxID=1676925 RepID=A0A3B3SRU8_9TELE|nr:calcium uniporter regulatory subunit MCUb, mitochondrial [Paramormyrops kingsleyae]
MVGLLRAGVLRTGARRALACYSATPNKLFSKIISENPTCRLHRLVFCSTLAPSNDLSVEYKHGRPALTLPLPSRKESCLFFLRPMLTTVGDFLRDVQKEDPGVSQATVLTTGGEQVSRMTSMDALLRSDFQLVMNNVTYSVRCPAREKGPSEHLTDVEDMKTLVHMLHTAVQLPTHHLRQERDLMQRLDFLRQELVPMEQAKAQIARGAEMRSARLLWGGLALLSAQGGALAWLTWWVYSWDIMEPVTYFLTYSTSIGAFGYYVLTKQDYVYPSVKDRQFLDYFYKGAKKQAFNVQKYNRLKEEVALVEDDLRRLRDPIRLRLPLEQLQAQH